MYTDIIKILKFVLIVLKDNEKTAFKASSVYDIYRQFFKVSAKADRILKGRLMWKLEHINSDTSFGSVENKWLYFNNQIIRNYEDAKHELLIMFGALESEEANPKYAEVFRNNFCSKSLNGRTNQHTTVAHIDESFQMIAYRFKFIENAKKVKTFRYFDELFREITYDLSTEEKRQKFIEDTRPQIDEIHTLLKEYENLLAEYYTISDLLLSNNQSSVYVLNQRIKLGE